MDYDIFREELALKYSSYGYALWKPSPGGHYSAVEVGDVGFIHEGYFHRLFNVLLPRDHPSHRDGAPPHHEPLELKIASPTYTGTLQPNHLRSNGVTDTSHLDRLAAPDPDAAARLHFSCSNKRGAVLSLPVPAQREDTAVRRIFNKLIIKHIDEWFTFAQGLGLGVGRREDIILVTGRDLARSWANIAFQERDQKVSFGVRVNRSSDVQWQFTPESAGGVAFNLGPSGQNLPENQCIFVRGIRVSRISRMLPWLRGGAGPSRIPGEDDPDPDTQQISIPADTDYQDPLHTLLEYIATNAPDCDMALVHDDDLRCIDIASLESFQPDNLMSYLQKSAPEIRQVELDCSPTNHENESASKAKGPPQIELAKIATLSGDMAVELDSMIGKNDGNIIEETNPLSASSHQDLARSSIMTRLLGTVTKYSPSYQERRADRKLELAFDMLHEHRSLIDDDDLLTFKVLIESAEGLKFELHSKRGIPKLIQARAYRRAARAAYKFIKSAPDKGRDRVSSSGLQRTLLAPESGVVMFDNTPRTLDLDDI